jgi:hypothetical protein
MLPLARLCQGGVHEAALKWCLVFDCRGCCRPAWQPRAVLLPAVAAAVPAAISWQGVAAAAAVPAAQAVGP